MFWWILLFQKKKAGNLFQVLVLKPRLSSTCDETICIIFWHFFLLNLKSVLVFFIHCIWLYANNITLTFSVLISVPNLVIINKFYSWPVITLKFNFFLSACEPLSMHGYMLQSPLESYDTLFIEFMKVKLYLACALRFPTCKIHQIQK